jgi:hypothetical protein
MPHLLVLIASIGWLYWKRAIKPRMPIVSPRPERIVRSTSALSVPSSLIYIQLRRYPHQVTVLQGREQNFFDYFSMELQAKYTPLEAQQIMVGVSDVCAAMPIAAVSN